MIDIIDVLIFGIVSGTILLLGSIGFSLVWKTENFLNITHGQMILLGAYVAYFFNVVLNWSLLLSAIITVVLTAFVGLLIAKVFFYPVRRHGTLAQLFTSVGLAYVIYGLVQAFGGVSLKSYNIATNKAFMINDYPIMTLNQLIIVIVAIISILFLHLFLTQTKQGRGIRAMAGNRQLSETRGIDTEKLSSYVWLIASGLGGLAGVLLGIYGSLHTELGWEQILIIMSVAVLGGLGSLYGTMIAALLVGIAMDVSTLFIDSAYRTSIAFFIIILVLLVRSQGLTRKGVS